jgi:hypothetical protein
MATSVALARAGRGQADLPAGDVIERVERIGVFAPVRRLRQQLPKPANT